MNFLKIVLIVVAVAFLGICIWQGCLFVRDIKRAKEKKKLQENKKVDEEGGKE